MYSLMIADPFPFYADALPLWLGEDFSVHIIKDGKIALKRILDEKPDFLVINMTGTEFDGIGILRKIKAMGVQPVVIGIIQMSNFFLEACMSELSVSMYLIRPFSAQILGERITFAAGFEKERIVPLPTRTQVAENLLRALVPDDKALGFSCLTAVIPMAAENPSRSYTKDLYPAAAKFLNVTREVVERRIRCFIDDAFGDRAHNGWELFFPAGTENYDKKPTNGEFISTMAKIFQMQKGQWKENEQL